MVLISGERSELSEIFPNIMISTTSENTVVFAGMVDQELRELDLEKLGDIEDKLQQKFAPLIGRLQHLK